MGVILGVDPAINHYENFPVASLLLPARLRFPVRAIYRFARSADDIADEGDAPPQNRLAQLDRYRAQLDSIARGDDPGESMFRDLACVISQHRLPIQLFRDLLDAFAQDVVKGRYANFGELMQYCQRSANPIGRLMLHLYQATDRPFMELSDHICSGLQLINFLQDVEADYRKNRIYIPLDELSSFGISEQQIAHGEHSAGWGALMQYQTRRAQDMLDAGSPLGQALRGRIGLELRMITAGGQRILEKLQSVKGDVFRHRPVLMPWDWPLMLLRAMLPLNTRS